MKLVPLTAGPLDFASIASFQDPKTLQWDIREGDLLECRRGPMAALLAGMQHGGECFTARLEDNPIGAFGYTDQGTIWSLWRPLSRAQAYTVLKYTPEWTARLLKASGKPFLYNWVAEANTKAIGWLGASRCFSFDFNAREQIEGMPFVYFRTREDLLHV